MLIISIYMYMNICMYFNGLDSIKRKTKTVMDQDMTKTRSYVFMIHKYTNFVKNSISKV